MRGRISNEMVELYKKGCSLNEVARLTGKSKAKVRAILHRKGISTSPSLDESKVTAWRKRRRTHTHPPFGFTYYLGGLVIQPREHEILMLIERLAKEGMNPNAIAEHLNENGLKPRRARVWNRNSVVNILDRIKENKIILKGGKLEIR